MIRRNKLSAANQSVSPLLIQRSLWTTIRSSPFESTVSPCTTIFSGAKKSKNGNGNRNISRSLVLTPKSYSTMMTNHRERNQKNQKNRRLTKATSRNGLLPRKNSVRRNALLYAQLLQAPITIRHRLPSRNRLPKAKPLQPTKQQWGARLIRSSRFPLDLQQELVGCAPKVV